MMLGASLKTVKDVMTGMREFCEARMVTGFSCPYNIRNRCIDLRRPI